MADRGPCSIEDCEKPANARKLCKMHYTRWRRTGDPTALTVRHNWSADRPTYRALHKRLQRTRGPATAHSCADCGRPAAQWSYVGGDPKELVTDDGMTYSPNLDAYVARCRSCHKRLDDPNPVGLAYRWSRPRGEEPVIERLGEWPHRGMATPVLASRDRAAALIHRHPVHLRRECEPVACDVATKVLLYDVDQAVQAFRDTPRRYRVNLAVS